ncbi:MAG: hypothetical protein Q7S79_01950 [bacterium]|nr:hypothetical protein [bacterium]
MRQIKNIFLSVLSKFPELVKISPVVFVLAGLELILFITNYTPGTYLIGWDSLHPEFNYLANFKRQLFSVWQEYRGLGLLDGMAHAANLPHTALAFLLDIILPQSLVRYVLVLSLHLFGGIGAYQLIRKILKTNVVNFAALIGAIFYMFNIATIQMFYTPFEVFVFHFAFLPWLAYFLIRFLFDKNSKSLIWLTVLSLLALPQAFVPQVFMVYLALVGSISLVSLFSKTRSIRRVLVVLAVIIGINSIWMLPYVYSLRHNPQVIINSKINQMSSEDTYLRNQVRGSIRDVFTLQGSMLDIVEFNNSGGSEFIMETWRAHLKNPFFRVISSVLTIFAVLGLLLSIIKRSLYSVPFAGSLLLSLFFLGSDIVGISTLNNYIRGLVPVLGEALRFPFTKFSILLSLSLSIFLAIFLENLKSISFLNKKISTVLLSILILVSLAFYSLPAFKGNFFFRSLRVNVPGEYFQTMDYFKDKDDSGRIATLPQPNFWSWRYHNNGYRGSGFLWMGVPQPTLDRAFDPWSEKNEGYYWELSYALYSKNPILFENVLEKYGVKWLVVDQNVVSHTSPKSLYFDEFHALLLSMPTVVKRETFGNIEVYEYEKLVSSQGISQVNNIPSVGPSYPLSYQDTAFRDVGAYSTRKDSNYFYPFRSLFTNKKQQDLDFEVRVEADKIVFSKKVGPDFDRYYLAIPELGYDELTSLDPKDLGAKSELSPEVSYDGEVVEVSIPKTTTYYSAEIDPAIDTGIQKSFACAKVYSDKAEYSVYNLNDKSYINFSAADGNNCNVSYWIPTLSYRWGYLFTFEARHLSGKNLLFWLENVNTRKPDIETYLDASREFKTFYFTQPPMELDGYGYSLHFDNISIGRHATANDLGKVSIYPIPYRFLTELVFKTPGRNERLEYGDKLNVEHKYPFFYSVDLTSSQNNTLVLSQAHHDGWVAFDGTKKLDTHLLVNNWANGWEVPGGTKKITLLFWPQYLQFVGIAIGIISICYAVYCGNRKTNL